MFLGTKSQLLSASIGGKERNIIPNRTRPLLFLLQAIGHCRKSTKRYQWIEKRQFDWAYEHHQCLEEIQYLSRASCGSHPQCLLFQHGANTFLCGNGFQSTGFPCSHAISYFMDIKRHLGLWGSHPVLHGCSQVKLFFLYAQTV